MAENERLISAWKLVTVLGKKFRNKGMIYYDDLMAAIADVPTVKISTGCIPVSNADHIRAMSDEELAELFGAIADEGKSCTLICGDMDKCKRNNSVERICKNHYLKWLKQPAEEVN